MVLVERDVLLLVLEVHGLGAQGSRALAALGQLVLLELFPCHLPDYLKLLPLLKLHNALLDLIVLGLLVQFPAFLDRPPDLVEPADDILSDLQFQLIDVLILHVFDGGPDEVLIDALAEQRTGLEDEPHLLLGQEVSGRVVLVQEELAGQVDLVVLVQPAGDFLGCEGFQFVVGDEPEPAAALEELGLVELVLEGVDVGDEEALVLLSPAVVDPYALVLVQHQRLVQQRDLLNTVRVGHALPDPGLVLVVADGLHELGLEFRLAHRVLVLELQPVEAVLAPALVEHAGHWLSGVGEVVVDLRVHLLPVFLDAVLQAFQDVAVPFLRGLQPRPGLSVDSYFLEELLAVLASAGLAHREQRSRDPFVGVAAVGELTGILEGKQQLILIAGFVPFGGGEHLSVQ